MGESNRGRPRPRWATLRVGEITAAMSIALVVGLGVGLAALAVDDTWLWPPPVEIGSVESARVLLGSIASGLITVAVFGLWMRTVVVGLMAVHFSPRTLLAFLDDRFQRNLLAFMAAGVVAVLVILLKMPGDGEASAPLVSTTVAIVIALSALAGVLLAIQHATRSMSLPELVGRLTDDALKVLDRHPEARIEVTEVPPPRPPLRQVMAPGTGWVTGVDLDRMRNALPPRGIAHLRCCVGVFVTPHSPIAIVSVAEADSEADLEAVANAFELARTRSPDMDLAFAVSQLVDVGTFALQTRGDTSTAHEVLVHLEVVLEEIINRGLPRLHDRDSESRCIYDEVGRDPVDLVQLCVERLRGPAARDPEAARHLMHMLLRVCQVAEDCEAFAVVSEVRCQVKMLLALAEADGMLSRDRERLENEARALVEDA